MTDFQKAAPVNLRGIILSVLFFSAVWLTLVGDDRGSWIIGGPAVLLAVSVNIALGGARPRSFSPIGVLYFIPYFLWQSLVSGIDVLRRTFALKIEIDPGLITYKTSLPEGGARVLLANTISLLPGTLSADLHEELIVIHTLDMKLPVRAGIQKLESRIALLFCLVPPGGADHGVTTFCLPWVQPRPEGMDGREGTGASEAGRKPAGNERQGGVGNPCECLPPGRGGK